MDVGDIVVDRINATVVQAQLQDGEVRIEMEYGAEQDWLAQQGLVRLERVWSQFNRLNNRLNEQNVPHTLFEQALERPFIDERPANVTTEVCRPTPDLG